MNNEMITNIISVGKKSGYLVHVNAQNDKYFTFLVRQVGPEVISIIHVYFNRNTNLYFDYLDQYFISLDEVINFYGNRTF